MAAVRLPQYWMPENVTATPTITGAATLDLNGPSQWVALIFSMPYTATIDEYFFRIHSATTGCEAQVRIETVNPATGYPTNTLVDATNAYANVTIASGQATYSGAFTGTFTVTAGTLVAYMVKVTSGTPVAVQFGVFTDGVSSHGLPYLIDYDTSELPRFTLSPLMGLGTIGGSALQIRNAWPMQLTFSVSFSSSSPINAYGNRLRLDVALQISGVRVWMDADSTGEIKLFDYDGATLLRSISFNNGTPPSATPFVVDMYFSSPITLSPADYWLVVQATSTTSLQLYSFDFYSAKFLNGSPMGGSTLASTNTNITGSLPGSVADWSPPSTSSQIALVPIIDGVDLSSGGGGEISHVFAS
jgi:hypothetical protein